MLYMPNITDYLKILSDQKVKDFEVIHFGECFKSASEALYSKVGKDKNLIKVDEWFCTF